MYSKIAFCFLFLSLISLSSFKPVNSYIHKAQRDVANGNLVSAKKWYLKALAKDPENFKANLGIGLMLVDYLENYSEALPYLEKARSHSKKDTLADMIYAIGKCHQNIGYYEKALYFFNHLNGVKYFEDNATFQAELKKRQKDCEYGLNHENKNKLENLYVVNAGKTINSPMPEYVPVFTNNKELLFTSKRKDDKKEQLNYLDGKYFESMYISTYNNGVFSPVKKYTIGNNMPHHSRVKGHESIVSVSQNGQQLYVFRKGKIFEIKIDEKDSQEAHKLFGSKNFDFYQSHAFLTKDGKTLYYTSEPKENNFGGTDIYKVVKINDTEWGVPENLGPEINTSFDEDAPFLSEDGNTLFFSSKGHPGYGNYDVYKCTLVNGKWSKPENMGEPINSAANDAFYVQNDEGTFGFLSSSRAGGEGDMDIYKINFLEKTPLTCSDNSKSIFSISASDNDTSDFKNKLEMNITGNFKAYKYEWKVNNNSVENNSPSLIYDYKTDGTYKIDAKILAYCDTCIEPIVSCISFDNVIPKKTAPPKKDSVLFTVNLKSFHGELSNEQLNIIGFKLNPIYFDFKVNHIREDAIPVLADNIKILKNNPTLVIEIHGYSDSKGTLEVNKKLSMQRAIIVRDYLFKKGVKKSQIKGIKARADEDLVNKCSHGVDCDEAMHQENRRVMFHVYNK
jgi:outer membrane protein OmpA-like peptidoglycan-associated protein/tetratricopeptide (TPR) repeat protein